MNPRANQTSPRNALLLAVALGAMNVTALSQAALPAPSNLQVLAPVEYSQFVGLQWQNNHTTAASTLSCIGVYQSVNNGVTFSRIAVIPRNQTAYTVTDVGRTTSYRFKIRLEPDPYNFPMRVAYCKLHHLPFPLASDYTSPFSILTNQILYPAVLPPDNVTCTVLSSTSIRVQWRANEPAFNGSEVKVTRGLIQLPVMTLSRQNQFVFADVSGLSPSISYNFSVRTRDLFGNWSNNSSAVSVATPASAPSGLQGVAMSDSEIGLSWQNYFANSGIELWWATATGTFQQFDADPSVPGMTRYPPGTPGVVLENVPSGSTFRYKIRAVNPEGVPTAYSNTVTVTTTGEPPPSTVTIRNDTQLPLESLKIDGQEKLPDGAWMFPGATHMIELPAGNHRLHTLSYSPVCGTTMYHFPRSAQDHHFTLGYGTPLTISVPSPTLRKLLSEGSGTWSARDFSGNPVTYHFFENGTLTLTRPGVANLNGSYLSSTYSPGVMELQIAIPDVVPLGATYNECDGILRISGDPFSATGEYTRQ
jgi:hypothetical protein